MLKEFLFSHVFMCSIAMVGIVSIIFESFVNLSLKGYVKASANMKTTRKKVMINLKNQFETIYGMDYQIKNIHAYVDKYLLKLRFLGITYVNWEKMPYLSAGLVMLLTVAGVFYGYIKDASMRSQVEIVAACGCVLTCLFTFFHIYGIKSKKEQIQIQLVDYLENYMTNRLIRNKESNCEWKYFDAKTQDLSVLKSLLKKESIEGEKEIAFSDELDSVMKEADSEKLEMEDRNEPMESDIKLLEEFVQSFLA